MLISRIQKKLENYPHITRVVKVDYIEVPAQIPSGFTVWVHESSAGCTVGFEGWHEEFTDTDEALNCFAFGLSNFCRLKVFRRGSVDYKWQVLYCSDNNWIIDSETELLFFSFWRRKEVRMLQNDIIKIVSDEQLLSDTTPR